jgi:hypothetical protein
MKKLHPETKLAAGSSSSYPVECRMELGNCRYCCNAVSPKLRQLLPFGCVYVDEAVHVADAESLHAVLGELLPLGS